MIFKAKIKTHRSDPMRTPAYYIIIPIKHKINPQTKCDLILMIRPVRYEFYFQISLIYIYLKIENFFYFYNQFNLINLF